MATLYWYGNSGNWSDYTNHWSNNSGNSPSSPASAAPTSTDDVIFNADSFSTTGTVTVDATANCLSMNWTGLDQAVTFSSSANSINIYGSLTLPATNLTWTFTSTAYVYLKATTSVNVTMGSTSGRNFNRLYFDGVGGTWTNMDDFCLGYVNAIYPTNGTWNTNNYTIGISNQYNGLISNGTFTLNCGSSNIYLQKLYAYGGSLTLNAGTSTFYITTYFLPGNKTYYNVVLTGNILQTSDTSWVNSGTYTNLTISNNFGIGGTHTVTGTLTIAGINAQEQRAFIYSRTVGTAANLVCNGTLSASNVDFRDITGAGSASWDLSAITGLSGDCGGNSGIIFTTAVPQYWHVGTGSWSDSTKWFTATNGGGSAGRVPLPQDDVYFDANSFDTSGTITVNCPRAGKSLDMSTVNQDVVLSVSNETEHYGSYILGPKITPMGSYYNILMGRATYSFNSYNKSIYGFHIKAPGGLYINNSEISISYGYLYVYNGTFDFNDYNASLQLFKTGTTSDIYVYFGNGIISINYDNRYGFNPTTNANIYSENSTIILSPTIGSNIFDIYLAGKTWNKIWISGSHTGDFYIREGNAIISELIIDAGKKVKFTAGTTTTVTTFTATGTAGNEIIIDSTTTGTHNLVKAGGGYVSGADYLNIQHSIATPANTWYAGDNSTNNQSVETAGSGWIFTSAPSASPSLSPSTSTSPSLSPSASLSPSSSISPSLSPSSSISPSLSPSASASPSSALVGFITEWTVSGDATARTITLPLHNVGTFNCTVDWGDGTVDSTITSYDDADRIHTYATDGTYQVEITGSCPAWRFNNGGDKLKITKIINWGNTEGFDGFSYLNGGFYGCTNLTSLGTGKILALSGLTNLFNTFYNCSNLTSIPSGIFDNCTSISTYGFYQTFYGCSGLTSIPSGLFNNNTLVSTEGFYYTFNSCSGLTGSIPSGLFDNNTLVSSSGFYGTFQGCSGLTGSIPSGLFDNNTLVSTSGFRDTFYGCSGLTGPIPSGLFDNNTLVSTNGFYATFLGCLGLTSIPTDLFRYNTVVSTDGFRATFYNCSGLTSIPTDLFRYNTLVSTNGFMNTFRGCSSLTFIPTDLFRYNAFVSTSGFYYTFYACSSLTSIPTDLFRYNTAVSSNGFYGTFEGCSSLTSVPESLFRYNTACTSFYKTFYGCNKLQLNRWIFYAPGEESTRFLNQSVSFETSFYRTSFTGTQGIAPELWICDFGTGTPTKTYSFGGVGNSTTSLYNYVCIPADWGGTAYDAVACAALDIESASLSPSSSESPSISPSSSTSPSPSPSTPPDEYHSHLKKAIIDTPVIVSQGGTGLASITDKGVLVGAGISNVAAVSPGTLGNVLKSDGTNWISGQIDLVTSGSVTYQKLAGDLVDIVAVSGTDIDWSLGAIYTKTLTTNTTFTFSNYQLDKIIILKITGQYALGFPTNVKIISGEYDGTVMNYITLHCTNDTSGSEEVWGVINQRALSDYDNNSQSPSLSPSVSPSPSA